MSNVLRVRSEPGGEWTEIPSIQGPQGEDGFSPVVTTTPIDGGTRVTITDATGDHSFDVMNGDSGEAINELITIKDTNVTNISQLPESSCCVHAINSEIGFSFTDDIIYIANLGSLRVIYTINGDMITLIADSTGNLSVDSSGIDSWARASNVYNKSEVDEKIAAIPTGGGTAADVSFDDSLAGLSAGNPNAPIDTVQKAIEALAEDDIGSQQVQDMIDDSMPDMISPSLFALLDTCGFPVEVYNLNSGIDKFKLYGSVWANFGMSNLDLKPLLNYEGILRAHVINNDMSIMSFYDKITYPSNCLIIRISANNILAGTPSNLKKYLSIIKYDNTTSGLTATTLSGAIDELAARPSGVDEATVDQKIQDAIAAITDFTEVSF